MWKVSFSLLLIPIGLLCVCAGEPSEPARYFLEKGMFALVLSEANEEKATKLTVELTNKSGKVDATSTEGINVAGTLTGNEFAGTVTQGERTGKIRATLIANNTLVGTLTFTSGKEKSEGVFMLHACPPEVVAKHRTIGNLKKLALAMHNYHSDYVFLPAAYIVDKDKKPILSWRVALLPFLGQEDLYKKFKLDEPWDGENNKKLLDAMPRVFEPVRGSPKEKHVTHYQVLQTVRDSKHRAVFHQALDAPNFKAIVDADGTATTVLIVEARDPVPWTKPEDIVFDWDKPAVPKLGGVFEDGFYAAFVNADVKFVSTKFNIDKVIKAIICYDDGLAVTVTENGRIVPVAGKQPK